MTPGLQAIINSAATDLRSVWEVEKPRWCPFSLYPKQELFLDLPNLEALFGGAAGSSKSVALLAGALRYVDNPKYSALLLRNTFANLSKRGALMDLAAEWLKSTGAKWKDSKKTWVFPSGATLEFGYLDSATDRYNYQGAYYNFIGFDELTQIEEDDYTYLMSRLRRTQDAGVPLQVRSTSNPGGEHHQWVAERFIPEGFTTVEAARKTVYEKVGINAAGEVVHRAFVPALLRDNIQLDQESYVKSLAELDPVTREQLLHGDWIIKVKGDIFTDWDERRHVISWSEFEKVVGQRRIPESWTIGIGHDWGSTLDHPYVVSFVARAPESSPLAGKVFLYASITGYAEPPRTVADKIRSKLDQDKAFDRALLWVMSHEAKSERDTYVMDHGLPFGAWKPNRTAGLAQLRDFLQVRGEANDLFRPSLEGSPSLYFIVDDEELYFAKTDKGLARHRLEMPLYHYDEGGLPYNKKLNDAIDSLRGIAAYFFPPTAPLTAQESRQRRIDALTIADAPPLMNEEEMALREIQKNYHRQALLEEIRSQEASTHYMDRWMHDRLEN